jgi:hypothetical protein
MVIQLVEWARGGFSEPRQTRTRAVARSMDMLEVLERGSRAVAEHDSYAALRKSAELVLDALSWFPGYGVIAASPAAERVLGAVMMLSPDVRVGSARDVVIFDVNVSSGTILARAADRLLRLGHNGTIVAVAIHALTEQASDSIEGVDQLLILERSGPSHQAAKSRDHRLPVAL